MPTARRRRTISAVAVSTAAHVVVLTVLALQTPMLRVPEQVAGPPEAVIPILILPRVPPPATGAQAPAPIRLHRRPQRSAPNVLPLEPLPALEARPAPPAAQPRAATHPAPLPEGPTGDVRAALRHGEVGCANAQAVGLNRAERDLCNERLSGGAKPAPFVGLGLNPDKQQVFDRAAAAKESYQRYKRGNVPPGLSGSMGDSGEPWKMRP